MLAFTALTSLRIGWELVETASCTEYRSRALRVCPSVTVTSIRASELRRRESRCTFCSMCWRKLGVTSICLPLMMICMVCLLFPIQQYDKTHGTPYGAGKL